ncbi:response regulator transcription factor [Mesorhizobium sp. M8A.F.Ca.ET.023.01.1.1]|nr:response regulator transcription factor [Mesorhizobium sp. M8A.F.Ca.ET.023.01.1.1]
MFIPNLLSTESGSESIVRARIVIVEDEPDLRDAVAEYLGAAGYDVATAETAAAARSLIETQPFHLAILDIAMPGEDGLSLGRWLRSKMPIGIIYATAAGTALDRIVGLELGADDYVTKPFGMNELVARIRVALRHKFQQQGEKPVFQSGDLSVDLVKRIVKVEDREVKLSPKEYDILRILVQHAGKVLTHHFILKQIWDDSTDVQYLRVYVRQLRQKIEKTPDQPRYITTETGVGYRLRVE